MQDRTIDYSDMVNGLAKTGTEILATMTAAKANNLHMAVGIVGEIGELVQAYGESVTNKADLIEEHGDIEFYMEGLRQGTNTVHYCDFGPPIRGFVTTIHDLTIAGANLIDVVKKEFIYNQELNLDTLQFEMDNIDRCLHHLCLINGFVFNRNDARNANISKLGQRYVDHQYTDAQAEQRNDKYLTLADDTKAPL